MTQTLDLNLATPDPQDPDAAMTSPTRHPIRKASFLMELAIAFTIASFLVLALALIGTPAHAQAPAPLQIVIVAGSAIKTETLTRPELRDIFNGASAVLPDGTRIRPVLLKPGPLHDAFLATYMGVSREDFHTTWMSLLFAGQSFLPPTLPTDADVVDYITHHPTAIGYINKATPHPHLTVITIH